MKLNLTARFTSRQKNFSSKKIIINEIPSQLYYHVTQNYSNWMYNKFTIFNYKFCIQYYYLNDDFCQKCHKKPHHTKWCNVNQHDIYSKLKLN